MPKLKARGLKWLKGKYEFDFWHYSSAGAYDHSIYFHLQTLEIKKG